jgi:hypothetical protein
MAMIATDIVRAILAPLTELTMLLPLLLFWGLLALGVWGGMIGVFVIIFSLPPLFRFQSFIVEAYANGRVPGAFDAEFFNWIGSGWTLFPLLLAVACGGGAMFAANAWGPGSAWAIAIAAAAILPASLAVLAITHSSLQALNPVALLGVYARAGWPFLVAPAYLLAFTWLVVAGVDLPLWAMLLAGLFLVFSSASLVGALIAPSQIVNDVYIPDAAGPDETKIFGDIERARTAALTHAYGFISRGNRKGGFGHLFAEIARDPDPPAAWAWYFEKMLGWEITTHALFFAQHYVHDALQHGEEVRALKVIMRCRLLDEQFRPFPGDVQAALAAAARSGNSELAEVLKRC